MFWSELFGSIRGDFFVTVFDILFGTVAIWAPILTFIIFINIWLRYRRTDFIIKQGGVLLEIRLPKEINKTPAAMELFLTALHQSGKGDYLKTFLQGKIRPWFSLELVSIGGQVHFFIWTHAKMRPIVETQLYAQYPGVEVVEVDDYAKEVFHDLEKNPFWATTFKLTKADAYPIKTYIDYGLENTMQEEESKVDPMTSVLEFLGAVHRGGQVWIQILIQAHRDDTLKDDARLIKRKDWRDPAKAEIKKLIESLKIDDKVRPPTKVEGEIIAALERSQSKFAFEVGMRGFYIWSKDAFEVSNISSLIGSVRQYSSNTLNGFKLGKFTDFDYPWQDFRRIRRTALEKKMLNAYKLRSYFNIPYKHLFTKPFILTTEELATIFHLPGRVATTPTLAKTPSKKGEAPPNLPV